LKLKRESTRFQQGLNQFKMPHTFQTLERMRHPRRQQAVPAPRSRNFYNRGRRLMLKRKVSCTFKRINTLEIQERIYLLPDRDEGRINL